MVGSPWLSKPIKKPMKNKQEDTKIKPDWEIEYDKKFGFYTRNMAGTEICDERKLEKDFIHTLLAQKEAECEKEKKLYSSTIKQFGKLITALSKREEQEINQLKQQHREQLAGLRMKRRELELVEPRLFQSNPTLNELGGYSSVPFYCSLCFMSEMDIQDNKLGENYHCHCSVWDSPTGGKWLKWFDEKKARQCLLDLPGEHNAYNEAVAEINEAITNLLEQKGK